VPAPLPLPPRPPREGKGALAPPWAILTESAANSRDRRAGTGFSGGRSARASYIS